MKKYVVVGTGWRGMMSYAEPLVKEYEDCAELAAVCDINIKRARFVSEYLNREIPAYIDFDQMMKDHSPDTVIVTTKDCAHEHYIVKALEYGCDVITEKPMTTDDAMCARILEAEKRTGHKAASQIGAELFIAVSHAVGREDEQNPMFEYGYEKAVIRFGGVGLRGASLTARFTDGRVKDYGAVGLGYMESLWNMIDAIRDDAPVGCPGESELWHVDALEKMRACQPEATPFPESWIHETEGLRWAPGLAKALFQRYETRELPRWNMQGSCL